ncbi:hypothetical protein IMZ48_11885 [Candidatus Bathyarchaeota archaeon]|nr:hypothetical protein [Candidatus Bathyarchaeota archaeon]
MAEALGDGGQPQPEGSRVETLKKLYMDWAAQGIETWLDSISGVSHDGTVLAFRLGMLSTIVSVL